MPAKTLLTCQEFEALCLAGKLECCELVDGEVIPLAPSGFGQGDVCSTIGFLIKQHVKKKKLGWVLSNEIGIHVRQDPPRSRGADVAFISYQRIPKSERPQGFLRVPPELVVEVAGERQTWEELEAKVADYHTFGVDMVWVADPNTRTLKKYPRGGAPVILHEGDWLEGGGILPGFKARVAELFGDE